MGYSDNETLASRRDFTSAIGERRKVAKIRWRRAFALSTGLMLFCSVLASGQSEVLGQVDGTVVNITTERPIAGAIVELVEVRLVATTDSLGTFEIGDVPVGVYQLRVRAVGFQPIVRANTTVGSAKPLNVRIELSPVAVQLDGIQVRPTFFEQPSGFSTSTRSIGADETRRAPGVQEDVVRAVALLPGVGLTSGGRNDLVVRGGAPYENLFIVDGIEVPNINHFGSQGSTGGPLSIINVDFVRRTDFSAGGFSAKYGDRTASLTSILLREGETSRLAGEVNLSGTGFGVMLEGPIGNSTSFLMGARRSYLDLLFKAAGFSFIPAYLDLQMKTHTRLDANNTVTFLGVGALNTVEFVNENADDRYDNSRILAPEQKQYFGGVVWKRLLENGVLTVTLGRSFSRFRTTQSDSLDPPLTVFSNVSAEGDNSLRVDLIQQLGPRFELNFGNAARYASRLDYDLLLDGRFRLDDEGVPQSLEIDTSFTALRNGTYLQGTYQLSHAIQATAGVRLDYYAFLRDNFGIAPRLGLRAQLTPSVTVRLGGGRYFQAPSFIWLLGDTGNPSRLSPIRSDQIVLGFESLPRSDTRLQLELFFKQYDRYPARIYRPQAVLAPTGFEDVTTDIPFGLEPLTSVGTGKVYGAELLVQKRLSTIPFYGLLSATLTRAEYTSIDGVSRAGSYDARFLGNLVAGWRPGNDWELSGKFRLATGLPTTPFYAEGPATGQLNFTQYNAGSRLPTFHALDLRIDRRWSFQGVQLETYIDVQNVYARKNVTRYEWDFRTNQVQSNDALTVLPTIGVNIEF